MLQLSFHSCSLSFVLWASDCTILWSYVATLLTYPILVWILPVGSELTLNNLYRALFRIYFKLSLVYNLECLKKRHTISGNKQPTAANYSLQYKLFINFTRSLLKQTFIIWVIITTKTVLTGQFSREVTNWFKHRIINLGPSPMVYYY